MDAWLAIYINKLKPAPSPSAMCVCVDILCVGAWE